MLSRLALCARFAFCDKRVFIRHTMTHTSSVHLPASVPAARPGVQTESVVVEVRCKARPLHASSPPAWPPPRSEQPCVHWPAGRPGPVRAWAVDGMVKVSTARHTPRSCGAGAGVRSFPNYERAPEHCCRCACAGHVRCTLRRTVHRYLTARS